jgi:hypothetical protein
MRRDEIAKTCARFCHCTCRMSISLRYGLVDERRRLERMPHALVSHLPPSDAPQLRVDYRDEPLQGDIVALSPGQEQMRHLCGRRLGHGWVASLILMQFIAHVGGSGKPFFRAFCKVGPFRSRFPPLSPRTD